MTSLIEDLPLRNAENIFADRDEAGRHLADKLHFFKEKNPIVLAIPSGGVPVGKAIVERLACDFELVIVKKIQIPWNTESGFGACNLDDDIIMNEPLLYAIHLSKDEIQGQITKTKSMLFDRNQKFRGGKSFPELSNRTVILVDDGLASGYTMLAAIAFVKRRDPASIVVAIPTGLLSTVEKIMEEVDTVACLNIRHHYPYAVAAAYRSWSDLNDRDVLDYLE